MSNENSKQVKYCYRCGTKYTGNFCPMPICYSTLYTTEPNSITKKIYNQKRMIEKHG
jgi:hypothetical protein